jgi:poly-gamma-glutamate synthesis protein (capsule biosynthesis protein)
VAAKMDKNGILYPAEKIREVLLDADITHISNEVSFVEDCYAAKPNTMVFCSKPEYIELLKFIDADVIELTGNHLNDYGSDWLKFTIDIYNLEGIPYFGGGINLEDSRKPALFEVNGNKLAFIGANSFGPSSDWATEASAGSAPINTLSEQSKELDMNYYEEAIKALRKKGYNVIFTFQYLETYNYSPTSQQVLDFERMSAAGAAVVSGSQAHQPQGIEISKNGFINFGLGNIFFGQALGKEVKQGIIAKHYFYRGRYIYTELITIFIEDFSQPRQTSGMERAELLKEVYNGSVMWQ